MDRARVTQLALGFWPARAFSAAAELGVYGLLASEGPLDAATVAARLELHAPGALDLLDALVGLDVLTRSERGYELAEQAAPFLDPSSRVYVGPLLESADAEAYRAWADLPDVLRLHSDRHGSMFELLVADPDRLGRFVELMAVSVAPAHLALVEQLDLAGVSTVTDLGGADGRLAAALARRHPHLRCTTFDLPALAPLAARTITAAGVSERVTVVSGDFFADDVPRADVIVLSLVLLDWDDGRKRELLRRARAALHPGGRLVIVDKLDQPASQERPTTPFELLRSLHLLVSFGDTFPYTEDDLRVWLRESGFGEPVVRDVDGGFTVIDVPAG